MRKIYMKPNRMYKTYKLVNKWQVNSKVEALSPVADKFLATKKVYTQQIVAEKVVQDSLPLKKINLSLKILGCKDKW